MQKSLSSLLLYLICPLLTFAQGDFSPQFSVERVVIDAGHGGKDPGAIGYKGVKEKDVALAIAIKTGNYIKEFVPGVEVIYTRSTDKFVELYQRAKIANKANADLFISIHANAAIKGKEHVHGTETFVLGTHRNDANLAVAKRENASILMEKNYELSYDGYDPKKPETHIILNLMQSAHVNESLAFAGLVENQFETRAKRFSRGVKQAGFMVLYKTTMPSVLVETGFVSNKEEANYLASDKGQNEIASGIYRAFKAYKVLMEGGKASTEKPVSQTKEKRIESKKTPKEVVGGGDGSKKAAPKDPEIKVASGSSPNKKSTRKSSSSSGKNPSGTYRIELYCSTEGASQSSKDIAKVGDIVIEYNASTAIRKFMLDKQFDTQAAAKAALADVVAKGFKNAQLILYQNGRRIVQ